MKKIFSLFDFQKHFKSDEDCYNYLKKARWPNGFVCPKCNHSEAYEIQTRKLLQCKECRYQASVTAGTIFHKLRQPLLVIFWSIYFISTTKKGISATELQKKLDIKSYNTAWLLLHKIRKSMKKYNKNVGLSDSEVDETYIGGAKEGTRGRGAENKELIAVALETDGTYIGNAAMKHINRATKVELKQFVKEHIIKGSNVVTDGFKSYISLENIYCHETKKMSDKDNKPKSLKNIHMIIGNLVVWLTGIFNRYPKKHTQKYLDEFIFRFNNRHNLNYIFNLLLKSCVCEETITFAELTK